jgi:hypothetical protein
MCLLVPPREQAPGRHILPRMIRTMFSAARSSACFPGMRAARSVVLAGIVLGASVPDEARGEWSGLIVPAYFSPSRDEDWQRLAEAAAQVPVMTIANVFNGPGSARREDYQRVIEAVRESGGQVIGYVHSTYTRRPIAEVLADIDRWAAFYPLDGVFVDEMTNENRSAALAYYKEIYRHAKGRNTTWCVVGNPGTRTAAAYLTELAADIVVTFESNTGYPQYTPDAWTTGFAPGAIGHLCYAVPASDMDRYVSLARERRAGWFYVTHDQAPNPWDRLPAYWADLVARVRELNRDEPVQVHAGPASPGSVRLRVDSVPGRYVIESSVDMARWMTWFSAGAPTGRVEVIFPATSGSTRFLRAYR